MGIEDLKEYFAEHSKSEWRFLAKHDDENDNMGSFQ